MLIILHSSVWLAGGGGRRELLKSSVHHFGRLEVLLCLAFPIEKNHHNNCQWLWKGGRVSIGRTLGEEMGESAGDNGIWDNQPGRDSVSGRASELMPKDK